MLLPEAIARITPLLATDGTVPLLIQKAIKKAEAERRKNNPLPIRSRIDRNPKNPTPGK